MGWSTATFEDATSFLRSRERGSAACVVAEVRMPGVTGFEMYEELVASGEGIPTVLITTYAGDSVRARASGAGIVCCLASGLRLMNCSTARTRGAGEIATW
jgi:FixJ family two-component response regulator